MVADCEKGEMLTLKNWRKAIRTPPQYRVGKNTMKFQSQFILALTVISLLLLWIFYSSSTSDKLNTVAKYGLKDFENYRIVQEGSAGFSAQRASSYNSTYPLTPPKLVHDKVQFKIGVVSDMDQSSLSKFESNTWLSYFLTGTLLWDPNTHSISITWDKNNYKTLKTKFSHAGRGMELSELVTFDGKLLAFDDRSGLIYVIEGEKVYPWALLLDGDGFQNKGFKTEWATVKDEHLYVGSLGKEWTTPTGEFINYNPMWVKKLSRIAEISHLDWKHNYNALRLSLGIEYPGYLIHESAVWSNFHSKWFFLPRRSSHAAYNEETDEYQGTNVLLIADENFKYIEVVKIGDVIPTHGFSSFKFIPGTKDEVIVALKTSEVNGKTETYIMAFTIHGKILSGEKKVDDMKFEGFEFI